MFFFYQHCMATIPVSILPHLNFMNLDLNMKIVIRLVVQRMSEFLDW